MCHFATRSIERNSYYPCRFFGFNFYRLGVGVDQEWNCTPEINQSSIVIQQEGPDGQLNETLSDLSVSHSRDDSSGEITYLLEYPCQWAFHYLTSGAAVWLAFLPFYITQLLGNCWRQCCCCLCDPLVRISRDASRVCAQDINEIIF